MVEMLPWKAECHVNQAVKYPLKEFLPNINNSANPFVGVKYLLHCWEHISSKQYKVDVNVRHFEVEPLNRLFTR